VKAVVLHNEPPLSVHGKRKLLQRHGNRLLLTWGKLKLCLDQNGTLQISNDNATIRLNANGDLEL